MTLVALLTRTNSVIKSEKDAQILYEKSIDLLVKLISITGPPTKLLYMLAKTLETALKEHKTDVKADANILSSIKAIFNFDRSATLGMTGVKN